MRALLDSDRHVECRGVARTADVSSPVLWTSGGEPPARVMLSRAASRRASLADDAGDPTPTTFPFISSRVAALVSAAPPDPPQRVRPRVAICIPVCAPPIGDGELQEEDEAGAAPRVAPVNRLWAVDTSADKGAARKVRRRARMAMCIPVRGRNELWNRCGGACGRWRRLGCATRSGRG